MKNIVLGTAIDGTAVEIDLKTLLTTRCLIQAASGGGKSRTLRRLAEQLFGRVPTFIIDREGEFATLREKYGFVLSGKGGETATDPRTAELLCLRLLENNASAIFDLYDLKEPDRHTWVKNFLDALMNAPKTLWRPVVIMVDEAHRVCVDSETEILTKSGWKGWKEVFIGQEVVAYDLKTEECRYEPILDVLHRPYEGEMISLKSDGIDALVTPDHRVVYKTIQRNMSRYGKEYGPYIVPAKDLPSHINIPFGKGPFGSGWQDISLDDCMAMGFIITDGNFTGAGKNHLRDKYISIEQSVETNKGFVSTTEMLEDILSPKTTVYKRKERSRIYQGRLLCHAPTKIYYLGVEESARFLNLFGDDIHRIPRKFLEEGSFEQLNSLFEGILLGDGHNCGNPTWGFNGWVSVHTGDYEPLADDVMELCSKLGISASKERSNKPTPQWSIKLSRRKHHYIRKTKAVFYSGMTWDITVPSGAFVARRRGKYFVTGNCPERGMGESEAYQSMIDLATDGRKRGFAPIYATQRLGKLSKNASAELLNRLIGRTIEDLDVDRAADLMSVRRSDRQDFDLGLKQMKPGYFWAFGQAVAIERKLVLVGPCETRHPEPGTPAAAIVPPTPEMVKKLLPQLADIPKEAEHKIRTEEELRAEIQNLKIRLNEAERRAAQKTIEIPVEKVIEKIVEVPAVDAKTMKAIHQVIWNIERAAGRFDKVLEMEAELRKWAETLTKDLSDAIEAQNQTKSGPSYPPPAATQFSRVPAQAQGTEIPAGNGASTEPLSNPQIAILRGLREFNAIDIDIVPRAQLAGWLGKKVSGSYLNDLSRLKAMGYIDHHETAKGEKAVVLTADGLRHAPQISWQVTPDGVFAQVLEAVSGPQKDILGICRKKFPKWILRDDVAQALNKVVSGSFLNDLSKLHTAMMIEYGEGQWKGHVRLMAWTILSHEAVAV